MLKRINTCQFELTFRCELQCKHCYTDCFNNPSYSKGELTTKEVFHILDKAYKSGVIWMCFTGGDPLFRNDFLNIYSYAKKKGFIITVFTNAFSMNKQIVKYFSTHPPFVVEITLNAVTQDLFEKITQVKGSFKKTMDGIDLILKAGISLKIKTLLTKDNINQSYLIKKFVEDRGLKYRPYIDLYARLNGDSSPCYLRISPAQVFSLLGKGTSIPLSDSSIKQRKNRLRSSNGHLFKCSIGGGDGFYVDPYGNTFPCNLVREPRFDLRKVDLNFALKTISAFVRNRRFTTNSKCSSCDLMEFCNWCPGRANMETGFFESPIAYYCNLTEKAARRIP